MTPPLAIDLFCGLGGWTEGLLAEGYRVVGFDIERHQYGDERYPAQLVLQDVLTIHGSQFRNAALIVASPPCQKYSYMAMPWTRAKDMIRHYEESQERRDELNALFNACFRIQREASEAAGHHVPMVVENVRGAQRWVGNAAWRFGSYYLWGDVPAVMPHRLSTGIKVASTDGGRRNDVDKGNRFTSRDCGAEGLKFGGGWWHDANNNLIRKASSRSQARKRASAQIAKIPFALARWIAHVYKPAEECVA